MRDRRRLLLAGAGVAGVLVGLMLLRAVAGEDGGQDAVSSTRPEQPTTTASEGTASSEQASLPPGSVPGQGRDPFLPVVVVPKVLSVNGSRQAPSVSSSATGTTAPMSASAQTGGTAYASLELESIGQGADRVVQLTVDGEAYTVTEGQTFSYGYRLERIIGRCIEVSAQAARAEMCLPTPT